MNLQQTRKSLGLSLRDAGKLVGVSHEKIRQAEAGEAGEIMTKRIRSAYREAAIRNTSRAIAAAIPEEKLDAMKKITEGKLELEFRTDPNGDLRIKFIETSYNEVPELGDFVIAAIASALGRRVKRPKKTS